VVAALATHGSGSWENGQLFYSGRMMVVRDREDKMPLAFESDKVMFEIYREPTYSGRYHVVYFTELNDHNRETEFNHALRGEHFYDGFLSNYKKEEAKQAMSQLLDRLNRGDVLDQSEVERLLKPYMP
jgi:hypothetical protein